MDLCAAAALVSGLSTPSPTALPACTVWPITHHPTLHAPMMHIQGNAGNRVLGGCKFSLGIASEYWTFLRLLVQVRRAGIAKLELNITKSNVPVCSLTYLPFETRVFETRVPRR